MGQLLFEEIADVAAPYWAEISLEKLGNLETVNSPQDITVMQDELVSLHHSLLVSPKTGVLQRTRLRDVRVEGLVVKVWDHTLEELQRTRVIRAKASHHLIVEDIDIFYSKGEVNLLHGLQKFGEGLLQELGGRGVADTIYKEVVPLAA